MDPVLEIPGAMIAVIVQVFAVAALVYKTIDGLKNMFPALVEKYPNILRIFNALGVFLLTGGACFVMGEVHDLFDVLKCLGAAVIAFLVAAGFYEAKRTSDLARAAASVASFKTANAEAKDTK